MTKVELDLLLTKENCH